MKKIFNLRITLLLAFFLGLGAVLSYFTVYYSFRYYWLIALPSVVALFTVIFILKRNIKYLIITFFCAALFLIGTGGVYFKIKEYKSTSVSDASLCTIYGTVCEKGTYSQGEYIKLKNITLNGKPTDGKIYVYLSENYGEYCESGYKVNFTGTVYVCQPFAYGTANTSRLIEDIRYICYPASEISSEYSFSLFGAANSALSELIFENVDSDIAPVSYAMLTGNTEYIESGTTQSFRYGGIAHIFAVSGLHIGLVYALVTFILKKLRVNNFISAAICVAAIFVYSGICGFTLSSLRAAIMCAVNSAVRLAAGKYDGLSSVSIAFIILVLINPLNILSVGFRLSIAAVAGISVFAPLLKRLLLRIKIPHKIAFGAAVSFSAQIFTFPVLLSSFGYVSAMSLLLNIIFVPVFSVIFMLLFAGALIGLLIPPLAQFILLVPTVPLGSAISLIMYSNAEKVLISGFDFGAFSPLYYLGAIFLSDKINIKVPVRCIVAVLTAAVMALCVFLQNYVPKGAAKIVVSGYYGQSYCVLFKTDEGNVLVVSESPSSYDISWLLSHNSSADLDAVIILGGEESVFAYTLLGTECRDVYVYWENISFQPYKGVNVHYDETFTLCGINFQFADGYNIYAECAGTVIGINMGGEVSISLCDLLIAPSDPGNCKYGVAVYFEQVAYELNTYDRGDLRFTVKNSNIFTNFK